MRRLTPDMLDSAMAGEAGSSPLDRELLGLGRIRFDGWRIIYTVNEDDLTVNILTIRQRDENTYLNISYREDT